MPTYAVTARFRRDLAGLTPGQRAAFRSAIEGFVHDLGEGRFRSGLRVKGVKGAAGVFEMTWAPDGRATFQYGDPIERGEPHVIWRRIGTRDVFRAP
ncbi:MAG: hypothetical protein ABI572_13150 [Actinomycetota bacterium]